jgi:hypothetical protein
VGVLSLRNKRITINPIRIKTSFNSKHTVNGVGCQSYCWKLCSVEMKKGGVSC